MVPCFFSCLWLLNQISTERSWALDRMRQRSWRTGVVLEAGTPSIQLSQTNTTQSKKQPGHQPENWQALLRRTSLRVLRSLRIWCFCYSPSVPKVVKMHCLSAWMTHSQEPFCSSTFREGRLLEMCFWSLPYKVQFQGIGDLIAPGRVVPGDSMAKKSRNPFCRFSSKRLVSASRQEVLFQVTERQKEPRNPFLQVQFKGIGERITPGSVVPGD